MKPFILNIKKNFANLEKNYSFFKKIKPLYILGTLSFIAGIFSLILFNLSMKEKRTQEINSFLSNDQTILLKNYIFNKIKSPYLEYDYVVKNNDTIESILKKFSVKSEEVAFIVKKIKKKDLSNIIPGQKIKFIFKKSRKGEPMRRDSFIKVPKKTSNSDGAL